MTNSDIFLNVVAVLFLALVCIFFAALVDIRHKARKVPPELTQRAYKKFTFMFSMFLFISIVQLGFVGWLKFVAH